MTSTEVETLCHTNLLGDFNFLSMEKIFILLVYNVWNKMSKCVKAEEKSLSRKTG
jgi:hypothetical protein